MKLDSTKLDKTFAAQRQMRILVAEDNPTNQLVTRLLLKQLGYGCKTVADGWEVLEAAASQHFDVILLDVQMLELDGIETVRRLRADPPPGGCPHIIAMTANEKEGGLEDCLAAGMDDFLPKPISLKPLSEALASAHEALRRRAAL